MHEQELTGTSRRTTRRIVNLSVSSPRATYDGGGWMDEWTKRSPRSHVQKSRSISMLNALRWVAKSQLALLGKYAEGTPCRIFETFQRLLRSRRRHSIHTQLSVLIVEPGLVTSFGITALFRGQKKTLMNDDVRSIAYLTFSSVIMSM